MPVSPSSKSTTVSSADSSASPSKGRATKDPGFNALLEVVAQVSVVASPQTLHQPPLERFKKQSASSISVIKTKPEGQVAVVSAGFELTKTPVTKGQAPLISTAEVNARIDVATPSSKSSLPTSNDILVVKNTTTPIDGLPTIAIDQSVPPNSVTDSKVSQSSSGLAPLNGSEVGRINSVTQSLQKGNFGQDQPSRTTSQQNVASVSLKPSPSTQATPMSQPFLETPQIQSAVSTKETLSGKGVSILSAQTKVQVEAGTAKSTAKTEAALYQGQEVAAVVSNGPVSFSTITAATSSNSNVSVGGASYVSIDQVANVVAAHISANPSLPSTIHLRIFPRDLGVLNIHLSGVEGSLSVKMDGTSAELGSQLNSAMGQLARELQAALAVKVSLNLGSFGANGDRTQKESSSGSLSGSTPTLGTTQPQRRASPSALGSVQHVVDIWA